MLRFGLFRRDLLGNLPVIRAIVDPEVPLEEMAVPAHYEPYSDAARLLARQRFVALDAFCSFLSDAQFASFYIHAERERIKAAYSELLGRAPYSEHLRFPEHGMFVAVSHASVRTLLNQMMHALEFPDRYMGEGAGNGNYRASLNDQKRSYDVAVDRLLAKMESVEVTKLHENGVYNRAYFERHHHCVWVEAVAAPH